MKGALAMTGFLLETINTWTVPNLQVRARERLLAEAESAAYVQRSHCRLSSTGFASGGHAAAASRRKSGVTPIAEKVKVARMNA